MSSQRLTKPRSGGRKQPAGKHGDDCADALSLRARSLDSGMPRQASSGVPANTNAFAGAHLGVYASPLEAITSTNPKDYVWGPPAHNFPGAAQNFPGAAYYSVPPGSIPQPGHAYAHAMMMNYQQGYQASAGAYPQHMGSCHPSQLSGAARPAGLMLRWLGGC